MTFPKTGYSKRRGFTLLEIIVAMSITLVIVGVLVSAARMATTTLSTANTTTKVARIASSSLEQMSLDLEALIIRKDGTKEWLVAEESEWSGNELGPDEENRAIANPLTLSFFTTALDRYDGNANTTLDLGGDVSLVRYSLIYQDVLGKNDEKSAIFALYRERIDPKETFEKFLNPGLLSAQTGWNTRSIVKDENFIAENIFEMTICFNYEVTVASPSGSTAVVSRVRRVPIVTRASGSNAVSKISIRSNGSFITLGGAEKNILGADETGSRLLSADISMTVLTDAGMKRIRQVNISDEVALKKFLNEYSYSFSKSVIVPAL